MVVSVDGALMKLELWQVLLLLAILLAGFTGGR